MSSREKAEQKLPVSKWALAAIAFVVIGGGESSELFVSDLR